ncbi:TIGR04282 family arsenosugar biosynthesis glycosyltransferase [Thiomonas sp.]
MSIAVIVFAKPPLAWQAKTRLIPALGANGAAALAARMLDHALAQAAASLLGPLSLYATARHATLRDAARLHGAVRKLQRGPDLGMRMLAALVRETCVVPAALLLGSDIPALNAALLLEAADVLGETDCVFVPTLDGGFALVGCTRAAAPRLEMVFTGQSWSTPRVMTEVRSRLLEQGLRWAELEAVSDIDTPADLSRLPAHWLSGLIATPSPKRVLTSAGLATSCPTFL